MCHYHTMSDPNNRLCQHCVTEFRNTSNSGIMIQLLTSIYKQLPREYWNRCVRDIPLRELTVAARKCAESGSKDDTAHLMPHLFQEAFHNLKTFKKNGGTAQYFKLNSERKRSGPREREWWEEARKNEW